MNLKYHDSKYHDFKISLFKLSRIKKLRMLNTLFLMDVIIQVKRKKYLQLWSAQNKDFKYVIVSLFLKFVNIIFLCYRMFIPLE